MLETLDKYLSRPLFPFVCIAAGYSVGAKPSALTGAFLGVVVVVSLVYALKELHRAKEPK